MHQNEYLFHINLIERNARVLHGLCKTITMHHINTVNEDVLKYNKL